MLRVSCDTTMTETLPRQCLTMELNHTKWGLDGVHYCEDIVHLDSGRIGSQCEGSHMIDRDRRIEC